MSNHKKLKEPSKVGKIFYVNNKDLGITHNPDKGHRVIVVSENKRSDKVKVKTITSLEEWDKNKKRFRFNDSKLESLISGKILPIPKKDLNSNHYSGIDHRVITIKSSKLSNAWGNYKYPRRYKHLITNK